MMEKKVSIIMAIYNSDPNKFKRAIESILNQTYRNFELIICDDGSENGIDDYIHQYNDERIIFIKNERNLGLACSLNHCLQVASGEYIARMDDDDISGVTRIEKQVEFLNRHSEYSIVGSAIWLIDEGGIWGEDYLKEIPNKKDLLYGVVHVHPTIMVRKEAYDFVQGYRVSWKTERTEDYDLYMRLYAAGYKGYNLQEKLFYYTQSKNTLIKRRFRHRIEEVACRYEGFRLLDLYPQGYCFLLKPIISSMEPNFLKQIRLKRKYRIS